MKKKIFTFLGAILITCSLVFCGSMVPVYAEDTSDSCSDGGFLGFLPWYHGLLNSDCKTVKTPAGSGSDDGATKIAGFVWTIVANVLVDLFTAVGYLATGFVIYGGYLYITSEGDPSKAAKAQKTLISAVIGIAIAVLANLIIRTIMTIIGA